MFKGDWRTYAAFGLLGLSFFACTILVVWDEATRLTEERIRDDDRAKTHIEYAQDRIEENCLTLEGLALRNCVQKEIELAKDHSRSEGDLDAQQTMARFTRVIGYTGIGGLILGVASVGLILATLWETRAGVEAMRSEQRPWVFVTAELGGFEVSKSSGKDAFRIYVKRIYENAGSTPAVNLIGIVSYGYNDADRQEFLQDFEEARPSVGGRMVPSRSLIRMSSWHQFPSSQTEVFFWVGVWYRSPLGGPDMGVAYQYRIRVKPAHGRHRAFHELGSEITLKDLEFREWGIIKQPT